ncbi:MAG: carboxypeptidase-like regulatory domain-containing protein [Nitrospira sp.]
MKTQWGQVRHRVAIGGRVLDGKTQRPVSGAIVLLTDVPDEFKSRCAASRDAAKQSGANRVRRLDEASTSPLGHYYFCDLPTGRYELKASSCGRSPLIGTGKANVKADQNGRVEMAILDLVLKESK